MEFQEFVKCDIYHKCIAEPYFDLLDKERTMASLTQYYKKELKIHKKRLNVNEKYYDGPIRETI